MMLLWHGRLHLARLVAVAGRMAVCRFSGYSRLLSTAVVRIAAQDAPVLLW